MYLQTFRLSTVMVSSDKQFTLRNNYPCFLIKRSMEGESAFQEGLYKSVQQLLLIKTGGSVSVFKSQSYKTLFLDTTSSNNCKHTPSTFQRLVHEKLWK